MRRGLPKYGGPLAELVAAPRAATAMGMLEEMRLAQLRGLKLEAQRGSVKSAMGRVKDWFVGNF